jgi:hypothetical protein
MIPPVREWRFAWDAEPLWSLSSQLPFLQPPLGCLPFLCCLSLQRRPVTWRAPTLQLLQLLLPPPKRLPLDEVEQHVANEVEAVNNADGSMVEEVAYGHQVKKTCTKVTFLMVSLGKGEDVVGTDMPQENVGNVQEEVEDDAHTSGVRERQMQHHALMLPVDTD